MSVLSQMLSVLFSWAGRSLKRSLKRSLLIGVLLPNAQLLVAQNTRITDNNSIGWLTNTTTLRFTNRWSGHLEYQFRRTGPLSSWQQSLFRTGINYQLSDKATLRIGYAFADTHPYGDYPIQAAGRVFPEHRAYQMLTLNNPVGRVEITHRFMLEQRWIGRFTQPTSPSPDETFFVNRLRYMARVTLPLGKPTMADKTPYLAAYDEILIGFGKNVNENVFDQNRLGLLAGYRFSPIFRIEGGFFQQIVQLPREITGRNVFQYNNGFILNTVVGLDLRRR